MDYDSPWKEILDSFFPSFMAYFFPRAYNEIDWERGFESLDTELRQIVREADVGRRTVDKLVKVWLQSGQEQWILIHIEVQIQEDVDFEERMFVYHYRLYDVYGRAAVSMAVLGDERPNWRPSGYRYEKWGCGLNFRFPTVKLLDYAAEMPALESSSNPFAVVVLAYLRTLETRRDAEARRSWKIALVKGLYDRGYERETIRGLLRFIAWMMELPRELEVAFWRELRAYEEAKKMPYVTSLEQMWLEQGMERGLERGRQEGRQEGEELGRRGALIAGIELALKLKFGSASVPLHAEIHAISSNDGLLAVHQAIEGAASLDEISQVVAAARARKNGQ
jgi:hypothetical protein